MKNYVRYKLLLEEPVKMGKQGDQSNTETLTYIVGSSVRGAFISLYINKYYNGRTDLDKDPAARKELFTDTKFSDAWITLDGKALFPFPAVYYADKHKLREAEQKDEGETAKLKVHCCISDVPQEGEVRLGRSAYCAIEKDSILQGNVKTDGNLHIAIGRGGVDTKMFRYEAIRAGQMFCGLIMCENESVAERYQNVITGKTIYLGGSKGSGYGRCKVLEPELIEEKDAFSMYGLHRKQQPGVLTVFALSNLILLNEEGEEIGHVSEKLLEDRLGITNVRLVRNYVGTIVTSGYNHTWKSWQVQRTAVSAGSFMMYTYDGVLNEEQLAGLEADGIGERRQEGFGRIFLNPNIEREFFKKLSEKPKYGKSKNNLSAEDIAVLGSIQKHVNERRMKTIIEYAAMKTADDSKRDLESLTKTQKARLYNLLEGVLDKRLYPDEQKAAERLRRFVREDIRANTGSVYNTLAKMKTAVGDKTLAEIIEMIANPSCNIESFSTDSNKFRELCFEGVQLRNESQFRLKCSFVKEVIYILMRKEGTRS